MVLFRARCQVVESIQSKYPLLFLELTLVLVKNQTLQSSHPLVHFDHWLNVQVILDGSQSFVDFVIYV